jgi:hypothetical protein
MQRHTGETFETSSVEQFREYVLRTNTVIGDKPIREIILEHSGLYPPDKLALLGVGDLLRLNNCRVLGRLAQQSCRSWGSPGRLSICHPTTR